MVFGRDYADEATIVERSFGAFGLSGMSGACRRPRETAGTTKRIGLLEQSKACPHVLIASE
jgi:hypothetical protein